MRREWDAIPEGRGPDTPYELYGGDLPGHRSPSRLHRRPGRERALSRRRSSRAEHPSLRRVEFRPRRSVARRRSCASLAPRRAHGREMRVVGDLSLNHCGAAHDWFLRSRRGSSAPERDLFFFDGSPPGGYACWFDVPSLPTLNWGSPELRRRMAHVFERWLAEGLDGWRIDVADMVGRYRMLDVNHEVAVWARDLIGDRLLVGEHGHDYRPDLDGRGWQGVMNYEVSCGRRGGGCTAAGWKRRCFRRRRRRRTRGRRRSASCAASRSGIPWDVVVNSWTLLEASPRPTAPFRTVSR